MISIGNLQLKSNLFLAPLAGYTSLGFRLVVQRLGGMEMATTDMINARALLAKNPKTLILLKSHPEEKYLRVQIFGGKADEMAAAAQLLESYGVAAIDINMGCPVDKVIKCGAGSKLMCNHQEAARFVQRIVESVKIPVTVKMRLGWDDDNITAPLLAPVFEDAGATAITIHGRTRAQGFSGTVNLDGIRQVVQSVRRIPVIGNGDILKPEQARHMIEATGCAGLMIGRGALLNPWIFREVQELIETGKMLPPPTTRHKIQLMTEHFQFMVEQFGERLGCLNFRKIGIWYGKTLPNGKAFHLRIVRVGSCAEYDQIVNECLLPFADVQYRGPRSRVLHMPKLLVPSGPNSMW